MDNLYLGRKAMRMTKKQKLLHMTQLHKRNAANVHEMIMRTLYTTDNLDCYIRNKELRRQYFAAFWNEIGWRPEWAKP